MVDEVHYHGTVRRDVFSVMPERLGNVLDIGGGFGATSAVLKNERGAARTIVVDLYADETKVLSEIDAFERGDAGDPEFVASLKSKYGPSDTILCLDVLEHLVDPWSAMKGLTSLLSEDGVIVASIPNVNHLSVLLPLLFKGRWRLADSGILDRTHLRFFVKETAIELMTSTGLSLQALDIAHNWRWKKYRLPHRMPFEIGERFLAIQYLMRVGRMARADM